MDRWPARFRPEDALEDRHESIAPPLERRGIARAELREGLRSTLEVGPPAKRRVAFQDQRDIQFGLKVASAAALELELAVPRHLVDRAMEKGVDVVAVTGPARVFDRGEAAADRVAALKAQRLQPGAPEVGLEDEAVVPRP